MKEAKRADLTKRKSSFLTEEEAWERGKVVELTSGELLGAKVDVTALTGGGDGFSGDLIFDTMTAGVKCLKHPDNGYFQYPKQGGEEFLDDIGILFTHSGNPMEEFEFVGWFTHDDWEEHGHWYMAYKEWVFGIKVEHMNQDWDELNEAIQAIEARRRERGIRQRLCGGRYYVFNGQMCLGLDDKVSLSRSL